METKTKDKFLPIKSWATEHEDGNRFIIVTDQEADKNNRYAVIVFTSQAVWIMGRKLTLRTAKRIVEAYPNKPKPKSKIKLKLFKNVKKNKS